MLACAGVIAVVTMATSPPRPGTAQPSPVTPRNGPLGTIAWPASGVSAAGISGIGVLPGPGASQPVPIASVAKVMTAYIILRDHPLGAGEPDPAIVVQPGEAAAYPAQARNGDSLVPVTAGEQLTERQALEALLLPSADNMAWILARWDADSQAAFTAQMNTTARRLGMTATHYTDPSGLSASTTSTAADQVRLGMAAMREPALAQIVALRSAVIPVAGVVRNTNTLLGQDGITGLKTGSDTAAGGCILLAAWQQARGHDTLIVAATFGQPGTMATMLPNALQAGHQLVLALGRALAGQNAQHTSGNKAGKYGRATRRLRPRRLPDHPRRSPPMRPLPRREALDRVHVAKAAAGAPDPDESIHLLSAAALPRPGRPPGHVRARVAGARLNIHIYTPTSTSTRPSRPHAVPVRLAPRRRPAKPENRDHPTATAVGQDRQLAFRHQPARPGQP
jgi:D-alanyl-D-alanine carboxypeptidase (penicillin-binding protein 5/6)